MLTVSKIETAAFHIEEGAVTSSIDQKLCEQWVLSKCRLLHGGAEVERAYQRFNIALFAPTLNTVVAGLPFAVAEELDPGAVHQQVQRPNGAAIRDLEPPISRCREQFQGA